MQANCVITSHQIAEKLNKPHRYVLSNIRMETCSEAFRSVNFKPSHYVTGTNRTVPCIDLTERGYLYLVMSASGDNAGKMKVKLINELMNLRKLNKETEC